MSDQITTRTAPELCARCGYVFDAASGVPGNKHAIPKEGDLSICLNCGHATVFTADLRKRPLRTRERQELPDDVRRQLHLAERFCMRALGNDLARRGGTA